MSSCLMQIGKALTSLLVFSAIGLHCDIVTAQRTDTVPLGLPPFIADESFTKQRVDFGEFLFSSTALSRTNTLSCITCHIPTSAYADTRKVSFGVYGRAGKRNTPSALNLYSVNSVMMDGRVTLSQQPKLPLENHVEMDIDWDAALARLRNTVWARQHSSSSDTYPISKDEIVASLATYVRTLLSAGSRFDRYYYANEDSALSEQEVRGLKLFTGKANCNSCHSINGEYSLFSDNSFHALGIGYQRGTYSDIGRGRITRSNLDNGKFRTPSLRNVELTPPYMHDGSIRTLRKVVEFYNSGGAKKATNKDRKIRPLSLSMEEIDDLVAFMRSLSSPVFQYYPWN